MKTFTKIFFAVALAVVCCTGYGATLRFSISNDGTYIPKTPTVTTAEGSIWNGQTGFALATYKPTLDWMLLGAKELPKTLMKPKRSPYRFTANSSNTSMLGVNLFSQNMKWDEGKLKASLTAYPNPSKGKITISLTQATDARYKITVSNTIGNVIKTIAVPVSAHNSDFVIDLSDKPAGVYFYSLLVNDKMVETKRLIIQQ